MKAYKFRASSHLDFALDIVFNDRLYCSDWAKLNDPMEGVFAYSYPSSSQKANTSQKDRADIVAEIIRENKKLRVCSLSLTYDCHLLWAHYASGFDGLAIEVELPDNSEVVRKVRYGGVFPHLDMTNSVVASEAASHVLTSKYQEWAYEKEVRILQQDEYFALKAPVKHIIAGGRMMPVLFEALRIICYDKNITLSRTGIGDEGIDADYVEPYTGKPM